MITKITAALLATSLLVACGGSGTPPVTAPGTTPPVTAPGTTPPVTAPVAVAAPKTFNQIRTEVANLTGLYTPSDFINPSTLPTTSGVVSYQGFSGLELNNFGGSANVIELLGTASLALDLGKTNGFSGTFSNFVDSADTPVPGTLTISNGKINRTGTANAKNALQGVLGGQLTINNNPAAINGTVGGDIVRQARDTIEGETSGVYNFAGVQSRFAGGFVAKK